MGEEQDMRVQIAVIATQVAQISGDMAELKAALTQNSSKYATKEELEPIRKVVYGMVSLVLVSFVVGLIALVWRN